MRKVEVEERRARLLTRHHLAPGAAAADPAEAARGVVALHSTDPASVFLSLHARTDAGAPAAGASGAGAALDPGGRDRARRAAGPRTGRVPSSVAEIERALYEERSLVRMLGMRRTMFVVPVELAPIVQASTTNAIAAVQRRKYTQIITDAGVGDGAWLKEVEEATAGALAARGEAAGAELSTDEPRLRTQVVMSPDKPYGGKTNITTWVLFLLAAEGRIVRGRPRGSWISSQYRWSPIEVWLPGGMPEVPVEEARAELARRWLAAYGPGTAADIKWWTGWSAGQVKQALAAIEPVEVDLGGTTGLVLPDDVEPVAAPEPAVSLLPALDPTPMGWQERSWYLGEHGPALFDRSGNVGPTVWSGGRIVGGWGQRSSGEVVYRLLEDVGRDVAVAVEASAGRLTEWIGSVRVTPRFRTPLERELVA
ncbi:winged helix DNA-binding domain-containing protein [Phytohabitans sp. ZYX-F-186]|uniref:Winged helix DNA-binding domain-containing protein n=1 Tax=Phytohabitans maris TaxID=3071409 RepID=A0ABU0ZVJ0_9ACTN|nr:winged helix DNA-binding domain-containing protein [Phytohabitans sp. ZYX-F-186]MDQ7910517.1 winged helix DNA-binding domain-containing protein [Phytohabitans sp. ZYX-F-186]